MILLRMLDFTSVYTRGVAEVILIYCQFVAGRYGNIRPQVADDMEIFGRKLRANIFIFGRKLEITVNL